MRRCALRCSPTRPSWNLEFLKAIGASASSAAFRHTVLRLPRRTLDDVVAAATSDELAKGNVGRLLGINHRLLVSTAAWRAASPTNILRLIAMFADNNIPVDDAMHRALCPQLAGAVPLLTSLEVVTLLSQCRSLGLSLTPGLVHGCLSVLRDSADAWFPVDNGAEDRVSMSTVVAGVEAALMLADHCLACDVAKATAMDGAFVCARVLARFASAFDAATAERDKEEAEAITSLLASAVELAARTKELLTVAAGASKATPSTPEVDSFLKALDGAVCQASQDVSDRVLCRVNPRGWTDSKGSDRVQGLRTALSAAACAALLRVVLGFPLERRRLLVSAVSHHLASLVNFPHGTGGDGRLRACPTPLTLQDALGLVIAARFAEAAIATSPRPRAGDMERVGGVTSGATYLGLLASIQRIISATATAGGVEPDALLAALDAFAPLASNTSVVFTDAGAPRSNSMEIPLNAPVWTPRALTISTELYRLARSVAADFDAFTVLSAAAVLASNPVVLPLDQALDQPDAFGDLVEARAQFVDAILASGYVYAGDASTPYSVLDCAALSIFAAAIGAGDAGAAANATSVHNTASVRARVAMKEPGGASLARRTLHLPRFVHHIGHALFATPSHPAGAVAPEDVTAAMDAASALLHGRRGTSSSVASRELQVRATATTPVAVSTSTPAVHPEGSARV
jgi:hypothetical protein